MKKEKTLIYGLYIIVNLNIFYLQIIESKALCSPFLSKKYIKNNADVSALCTHLQYLKNRFPNR